MTTGGNDAVWPKRFAAMAAIMVVMCSSSFVGSRFAGRVVERYERGAFIFWESVPLPDEQYPKALVIGEGPYVYVETNSARLLAQRLGVFMGSTWVEPEEADSGDARTQYRIEWHCGSEVSQSFDGLLVKDPPGVVVDQLDCSYTESDFGGCVCRYVILDNGELWRWRKWYTRFSPLERGLKMGALVVGFTAVWGASGALLSGATVCAWWMVLRRLWRSGM
jgi:hypothetical protein